MDTTDVIDPQPLLEPRQRRKQAPPPTIGVRKAGTVVPPPGSSR